MIVRTGSGERGEGGHMTQSWSTLGKWNVEGGEAVLAKSDRDQIRLDLPPGYTVLEVRTYRTATQLRLAPVPVDAVITGDDAS
jgi:hypothetical protein